MRASRWMIDFVPSLVCRTMKISRKRVDRSSGGGVVCGSRRSSTERKKWKHTTKGFLRHCLCDGVTIWGDRLYPRVMEMLFHCWFWFYSKRIAAPSPIITHNNWRRVVLTVLRASRVLLNRHEINKSPGQVLTVQFILLITLHTKYGRTLVNVAYRNYNSIIS